MSARKRDRTEFATLYCVIPTVLVLKLQDEADSKRSSVTQLLTEVLAERYKVDPLTLPRLLRVGRKKRNGVDA